MSAPPGWLHGAGDRVPAEQLLGVTVPDVGPERARAVQTRVPATLSPGWLGVLVDAAGGRPLASAMAPDREHANLITFLYVLLAAALVGGLLATRHSGML